MLSFEQMSSLLPSYHPVSESISPKELTSSSRTQSRIATLPTQHCLTPLSQPTLFSSSKLNSLRPLPCDPTVLDSSSPAFDIAAECVGSLDSVTVRVKIGAFFSIRAPQSLIVERISFNFADSLLPWNSPCSAQRTPSCKVTHNPLNDTLSVTSLNAQCECHHPLRSIDTCRANHPLSLFNAFPQPHHSSLDQKSLILEDVMISHLYSFYNSVVGFSESSPFPLRFNLTRF